MRQHLTANALLSSSQWPVPVSPQVVVEGIVRRSETPGSFVPANAPPQWYWLDAPGMAAAAQLPPETQLVEVIADVTVR